VADLGQQWEKVSERVGRMSSDCRDRYRNHIANREVRVTGPWSKEEEEELTRIVAEMTIQQGRDFDNDVFWGLVSDRMGNRRGRQQCRIKWSVNTVLFWCWADVRCVQDRFAQQDCQERGTETTVESAGCVHSGAQVSLCSNLPLSSEG